jgi:hypothetical protein
MYHQKHTLTHHKLKLKNLTAAGKQLKTTPPTAKLVFSSTPPENSCLPCVEQELTPTQHQTRMTAACSLLEKCSMNVTEHRSYY